MNAQQEHKKKFGSRPDSGHNPKNNFGSMNSRSNEPQQFFIYNLPKRLVMLKGRPTGF
jgi:hypothetical protein